MSKQSRALELRLMMLTRFSAVSERRAAQSNCSISRQFTGDWGNHRGQDHPNVFRARAAGVKVRERL